MAKVKSNSSRDQTKSTSAWAWMLLGVMLGFALFSLSFVFIPEEDRQFAMRTSDPSLALAPPAPVTPAEVRESVAEADLRYSQELSQAKPTPRKPNSSVFNAAEAAPKKADTKKSNPMPDPMHSAAKPTLVEHGVKNGSATERTPVTAPAVMTAKTGLILQAGAFRELDQARRLQTELTALGLPCYVQTAQVNRHTYHRVRLGPFADKKAMQAAQLKLRSRNIETIAMQVP